MLQVSSWTLTALGKVPPLSAATDIAQSVVRQVFGNATADHHGRCDLQEICRQGRFNVKRLDRRFSASSHDALLVPATDGSFTILVDPIPKNEMRLADDVARHRNRFRIAHEIGHSFFYDRSVAPPRRIVSCSDAEEVFCDEFASALLVPRPALSSLAHNPRSVFDVSRRFDVSVEMAARAFTRVHSGVSVAGLLWKPHPRKGGRASWRVTWSAGPQFIPQSAAFRSEIANLGAIEGDAEGVEKLNAAGLRGYFRVSAAKLPKRRQLLVVIGPKLAGPQELWVTSETKLNALPLESPRARHKSIPKTS